MGAAEFILLIAAMVGVAIMLPSMVGAQHTAFTDQVAKVEAGQLARIDDAALQYEYSWMASLSAPGSTHTVTVATLIQQGYLSPGTSAVDAMGDPISVEYQADASGNVTGYVIAQGSYRYPDADAGQILLDLGDRGGYVPEVPVAGQVAGTIYGTGRTWQAAAPAGINPGSIDVKVESNAAQQADDSRFLWRVPAPTAAGNTMSTPLILGAVETPGASCANTGAIAQDGTGALVSCQSGTWQSVGGGHWRAPVSTYAALPSSGNQNGDVRLTLDTDRAFAWSGSSWQALAVDQNGDLTVPNQLTAENGQVSTSMGCDGHAGMTVGEINAISEPTCGSGAVGFDLGNTQTGIDTTVFNQSGLQVWNARYGTMFHVNYTGQVSGPGYAINNDSSGWGHWGFNPNFAGGWSMVTSVNGQLNAQPENMLGSIHANDYFDRATGEWFSQVANQVNSQQGEINNLNNEYATQQGQINSNTSSIGAINNNLNQGPCSTGYNSIATLCNEFNSAMGSVANLGKPENCGGGVIGSPTRCGPVGPSTYSYWGWCGYRYYRYRCIQYGTSPPTVNLPTENYPQLVVAVATAGIGQGGCYSSANTGVLTLTATSGGAQLAQSASYSKGGSNYNPATMYFPFSITFVLPAGQGGQIELSGGQNGLGCGNFMYSLYAL
ncbi:MAG: hypothetical protein ACYCT1_13630 [Steroidobacteraceae bacterium]